MNHSNIEARPSSPSTNEDPSRECARVLHVNSGNLYGGVETILVTLARLRHLCPSMETHYALCHQGRLSEELSAAGVPVHLLTPVRISRPWTVWRARRRLRTVLRSNHFDLVVCHMPWSLAVFGSVVSEEGVSLGFWAHAFHTGRHWLERLAQRTKPNLAIGNSRFTGAGLANLFPGVTQGIVYPPVALLEQPHAAEWRSQVRSRQSVKDNTVVIIQVSRLEAGKGHLLHLEALARIKNLRTPWVCWMVGGAQRPEEQEYLERLEQTVTSLGLNDRVKFLGQRSDVPQLLAAADIFCQPNHLPESFGISYVEALWAGRPVVTTALGGAKEIVDACCGFQVEPGDVDGIAGALQVLIEHPGLRTRLGSAGKSRASGLCDPAAQMRSLSTLTLAVRRQADTL